MYFIDRDGDQIAASAAVGESLLDVALNNSIELEGTYRLLRAFSCFFSWLSSPLLKLDVFFFSFYIPE